MSTRSSSKSPRIQRKKSRSKTISITDPVGAREEAPVPLTHGTPTRRRVARATSTQPGPAPSSPAVPARPSSVALSRLTSSGQIQLTSSAPSTPPVPSRPSQHVKKQLVQSAQATLGSIVRSPRDGSRSPRGSSRSPHGSDGSPSPSPSPRGSGSPASSRSRPASVAGHLGRSAPLARSPRGHQSVAIARSSDPEEEAAGDDLDADDDSDGVRRQTPKTSRLRALSSSSMLLSRSAIHRAATTGDVEETEIGVKVKQPLSSEEAERKRIAKAESVSGIQWKRSPDAEKIMELLQMEGALHKPEIKTVEVDRSLVDELERKEEKEKEERALAEKTESEERKKKKLLRRSRKGNDGFVITRDASTAGSLNELEQELSSVQQRPDSGDAAEHPALDPRTLKRFKIATEIRVSERAYTQSLQCLVQNYMKPLCSQASKGHFTGIEPGMIKAIFSNVTLIQNVNTQLYSDLEARLQDWTEDSTIGDIFMDVAPYFKMYNQYGNNYQSSIEKLNESMKDPIFAAALDRCDESHQLGNKIEALLIAPIQRIPRYLLLLRDLQEATEKEHPDHALLESALPLMQGIADYINHNIKQAEKLKKFMEISSGGAKALMQAHRTLQFDGVTVDIKSSKTKYHLYIFNDIIIVTPESKSKNKELLTLPHYQWPLHLVWYTYHSDSFKLQGPGTAYHMKGLNAEETAQWQKNICTAQAQHMQSLMTTQDRHLQREREAAMSMSDLVRFGSFQFEVGAVYEGQWKDGIMEGRGAHTYLGNHFVGLFHGGKKTGKGVMEYMTGGTYDGEWLHDRPHGRGEMVYANGDRFKGNWLNGMRSGDGVLTCTSGDIYDGKWAKDRPEGLGTMTYSNGATYIGNWKAGRRHCQGILTVPAAGQVYEGNWHEGMREGAGKMTWNDGSFYEGQWKHNQRHGKGIYKCPTEGLYNGEWVNDSKEGVGTQEFLNGNVYIGSWKRGLFHGQGKLTHTCGTIHYYDGEWVHNKRHGKGTFAFFNGDKYEGFIKDDVMHGMGEYTWACGSVLEGKWVKGKPDGKVTMRLMPGREVITGTCKDGYITEKGFPPVQIQTMPEIEFSCW